MPVTAAYGRRSTLSGIVEGLSLPAPNFLTKIRAVRGGAPPFLTPGSSATSHHLPTRTATRVPWQLSRFGVPGMAAGPLR